MPRLVPVLFLLSLLLPSTARAQNAPDSLRLTPAPAPNALADFSAGRTRFDQRGLTVLAAWAAGNLAVSGVAAGGADGAARYFHQMNLGWGAVNLALAGTGYLAARRAARLPATSRAENVRAQLRTENLYLLNAGLDAAYLATGWYLLEKGRNPTAAGLPERWRGYGQSLLLQGGFLLLFDGVQYAAHHRHGQRLYPLLARIRVGPGGVALVWPLGQAPSRI